jgi:hypothetical protein
MHMSRACDSRVADLKAQHAAAIVNKETTIAKLEAENTTLKAAIDFDPEDFRRQKEENERLNGLLRSEREQLEHELSDLRAQHATLKDENAAIANVVAMHRTVQAELEATLRDKQTTIAKLEAEIAASKATKGVGAQDVPLREECATQGSHAATTATSREEQAFVKPHAKAYPQELAENLSIVNAALATQVASKMAHIHTIITQLATEVHPLRRKPGQFAALNAGPLLEQPKPATAFDRAWRANAWADDGWGVGIDLADDARADVTHKGRSTCLTLRTAAPLCHPRDLPPIALAAATSDAAPTLRAQLPWFCVVVEKYNDRSRSCYLGFVPSQRHDEGAAAAAAASAQVVHGDGDICTFGGWRIDVCASRRGAVHNDTLYSGWTVLRPYHGAALEDHDESMVPGNDISAYATTDVVPPVPEGGAVGFAVDYTAGTCRVAFYTPAAVASGFVDPPHAKMELRFVVTEAKGHIPARPVPTVADSGVELYPAVMTCSVGTIWRFVAE